MLTPDRNIIPRDALNKKSGRYIEQRRFSRIGITMSREAELLRLADVCYSQANATLSRAVKRALREMGDNYQHEAKRLREQALSDRDAVGQSRRPQQPISAAFART